MSYLVLARKWRPRDFEGLVGQEHVVRALTHALSTQRLHHAWLFTGTRGVGKTTLSRILAKSLNCETGITATPCGQCRACTEIDGGRFVDYVELDAASNRGVDEMTTLLEQAVYAPAVGRFKVYMIDEVHMLSGHAFNAMLKTLEEPPPHVKFILATTDPQKIPPTILSRCLQFNLKQMPPDSISQYLTHVLEQEQVSYEPAALNLIGQSASGSMRDALSLTDQAIAYSAANLTLEAVQGMLGSVDKSHLVQLLQAISKAQATEVLAVADALATRGLSFKAALGDLAVLLSRVAIHQHVGAIDDESLLANPEIDVLAQQLSPDMTQLLYTIAVHGRQEITVAPDEYAGFVMVCLKMLSFSAPAEQLESANEASAEKKTLKPEQKTDQTPLAEVSAVSAAPLPSDELPTEAPPTEAPPTEAPTKEAAPASVAESESESSSDFKSAPAAPSLDENFASRWPTLAAQLPLTGMAQQCVLQAACLHASADELRLLVPTEALAKGPHLERVKQVLTQSFGAAVKLTVSVGEVPAGMSAHWQAEQDQQARQQAAEQTLDQDPFVQSLIASFGANIVPGSVKPVTAQESPTP
ncbi:MAG: DNA polymerase III subunit gamma/tau [Orrella sp.]